MLKAMLEAIRGLKREAPVQESQAIIELATFFYKVDLRVAIEEQDYLAELMPSLPWSGLVSRETFHQRILPRVSEAASAPLDRRLAYLAELIEQITTSDGKARALEIAAAICDADGEISDDEMICLDYLKSHC